MLFLAVTYVLVTRRPVNRITYKVPKKDFCYEVRIGDLFDCDGEIVVSTNTTFDTDMSNGLISNRSLQGQMAVRYFGGNTSEIDRQIEKSLKGLEYTKAISPRKSRRYPIGTVARVSACNKNFYLLAMAELNEHGNASSSGAVVDRALNKLWQYIAEQGDLGDVIVPLIGTGRGRIDVPRRKIVEKVAQSFADASREKVFTNKLVIVISKDDAVSHGVNLFEIRDYISQNLHI
jgi:hypothetical protein